MAEKDTWDKAKVLATFLMPLAVVGFGFIINTSLQQREVEVEYVKLAMGILASRDTAPATAELRGWAFDIVNEMAPRRLPEQVRTALVSGQISLPESSPVTRGPGPNPVIQLLSTPSSGLGVFIDDVSVGISPTAVVVSPGAAAIQWRDRQGRVICSWSGMIQPYASQTFVCDSAEGLVTQLADEP